METIMQEDKPEEFPASEKPYVRNGIVYTPEQLKRFKENSDRMVAAMVANLNSLANKEEDK
jgi:hypothetical protein